MEGIVVKNTSKHFQQVARKLRKDFPLRQPLKIVRKDLAHQKLCGSCLTYLNEDSSIKKFVLEIDSNLSAVLAVETLLHEYAHALDQSYNGVATEAHRASWGVCYAQLWRYYVSHFT
jgi:hypothetical protein